VQSSSQIITTNKPTLSFFTGRMPFLSPNQQCQSTGGKNITFHGLAYPKLTWDLPTLSLTTDSSWLPWGRVAESVISTPSSISSTSSNNFNSNNNGFPFSALTLLVEQQERHPACKKLDVGLLVVMI